MIRQYYIIASLVLWTSLGVIAQTSSLSDSIWKEVQLEDVVVTAQYAPTHIKNAVHEVKVLEVADLQRQGQTNLAEVLTNQLNIRVSVDPILGSSLSLQGMPGENVQILIDGVPVIGRVGGDIDLSQLPLNNIERIEIIKGALSAQYGNNAAGGVINLITKKTQLNPVQAESQHQYENVGIWSHQLSLSGQHKGLRAALGGQYQNSQFAEIDSLRLTELVDLGGGNFTTRFVNPWNPKTQYQWSAQLGYRFSDSMRLDYRYNWFDEEVKLYGAVQRPSFMPFSVDQVYTTIRRDHNLNLEGYLSPSLHLKSVTAYNKYERERFSERLFFDNDSTEIVQNDLDTTTFNALLHRSSISTTLNGQLNGQLGLEVLHETGTGKRIVDTTSMPVNKAILTNYAAWLSLDYRPLEQLRLVGNLRFAHNTKYDPPIIPSVHLNWNPSQDLNVKLSYAKGFRAPTLKELYFRFIDFAHYIIGNPDLKAENSRNLSLTATYDYDFDKKNRLQTKVSFFHNNITDRIVLAAFDQFRFDYQNIDRFSSHGANLELQFRHGDNFNMNTGLAYTRQKNYLSDEHEDTDDCISLFEMSNNLNYFIAPAKLQWQITHRFIGQRSFFYLENSVVKQGLAGNYHLLNTSLTRAFWQNRITLSTGIKNLTDTREVARTRGTGGAHSGGSLSQTINWGRTYFVRLQLAFGG